MAARLPSLLDESLRLGRLDPEHPHLEGEGGGLGHRLREASIAPHEPRCPSAGRPRDGPQQKNDQEPQPHHREGRREADQRRRAEDRDQGDERTQPSGQEDRDVRGLHGVVRDRFLHGPLPARGLVVPRRAENARSVAARVPASTSADVRAAMAATARPAAPASTPAPTAHHRSTETSTEDRPTRGTSTWSAPSAIATTARTVSTSNAASRTPATTETTPREANRRLRCGKYLARRAHRAGIMGTEG